MSYSGNEVFKVEQYNMEQYVVNMRAKECACRCWQLTCIPCVHSMAVIVRSNMEPFQFVDEFYKKETYLRAYTPVVYIE